MNVFTFRVYGIPKPGGSKRYMGRSKKTGRAIIIDACAKNKSWRESVKSAAIDAGAKIMDGPLNVTITFFCPRPRSHYRGVSCSMLKPSAPEYPLTRPDALKLVRSTEDALTGVCWRDDAQNVIIFASKIYTDKQPGATVCITQLSNRAALETAGEK